MDSDVQSLINELDTDDQSRQRATGNQLIALGDVALPDLVTALAAAPPRVRKSIAYVLSTHKTSEEAVEALGRAVVDDPEPKVRKNAAVSLGTIGATAAVGALARALHQEQIGWVRPSIMLALGAIGGMQAHAILRDVLPQNDQEREALRKALDRTSTERRSIGWRKAGLAELPLLVEIPVGLETVAIDEAMEQDPRGAERSWSKAGPGLLLCPPGSDPEALLATLRCVYHVLIDGGHGMSLPFDTPKACGEAVADLLNRSPAVRQIREWLAAEGEQINYRLTIERKNLRRETVRVILQHARAVCLPLGLVDSPSHYDIDMIVRSDAEGARLLIRPSFMRDTRFAYREKDVGASINPVVGACLARLLRSSATATVFDPTCGSGTLLIERALLDQDTRLRGMDISRTAVSAAHANIRAAKIHRRTVIVQGDATQAEHYLACDEVVANLPFGLRTRRPEADLELLYDAILSNIAGALRPGGRALLYTAGRKMFEASLARHARLFRVERHLRVLSGGLWTHLWILSPTQRIRAQSV